MINYEEKLMLLKVAVEASKNSYSPYSNFRVGAAVLTKAGNIYQSGSIENVSYGATVCVERVAIWKAVSEGEKEFAAIALIVPERIEDILAQCAAR